MLPTELSNSLF